MTAWIGGIGFISGVLLGALFFGGLLYTVRHLSDWHYPKLMLLASFAGRSLIALSGFYLILQWHLGALFIALISFFLTRIYFTRKEAQSLTATITET
jgi:F1F0 ATPase subunit 2